MDTKKPIPAPTIRPGGYNPNNTNNSTAASASSAKPPIVTEYTLRTSNIGKIYNVCRFSNKVDFSKFTEPVNITAQKPVEEEEEDEEDDDTKGKKKQFRFGKKKKFAKYQYQKDKQSWVIEDANARYRFEGTIEGGQTANYVLFIMGDTKKEFKVLQADKWYNFRPAIKQDNDISVEDAEKKAEGRASSMQAIAGRYVKREVLDDIKKEAHEKKINERMRRLRREYGDEEEGGGADEERDLDFEDVASDDEEMEDNPLIGGKIMSDDDSDEEQKLSSTGQHLNKLLKRTSETGELLAEEDETAAQNKPPADEGAPSADEAAKKIKTEPKEVKEEKGEKKRGRKPKEPKKEPAPILPPPPPPPVVAPSKKRKDKDENAQDQAKKPKVEPGAAPAPGAAGAPAAGAAPAVSAAAAPINVEELEANIKNVIRERGKVQAKDIVELFVKGNKATKEQLKAHVVAIIKKICNIDQQKFIFLKDEYK